MNTRGKLTYPYVKVKLTTEQKQIFLDYKKKYKIELQDILAEVIDNFCKTQDPLGLIYKRPAKLPVRCYVPQSYNEQLSLFMEDVLVNQVLQDAKNYMTLPDRYPIATRELCYNELKSQLLTLPPEIYQTAVAKLAEILRI